jgi:hypothetical protein
VNPVICPTHSQRLRSLFAAAKHAKALGFKTPYGEQFCPLSFASVVWCEGCARASFCLRCRSTLVSVVGRGQWRHAFDHAENALTFLPCWHVFCTTWAVSREPVWAGKPVWPPASRSRNLPVAAETVPLARAHQDLSSNSGAWTAHSPANSPADGARPWLAGSASACAPRRSQLTTP